MCRVVQRLQGLLSVGGGGGLLRGLTSIVRHKCEMVLVFTPEFLYRQLGNDMRTARWAEAGRGGSGPHLQACGPIVLVYCLSEVIFIQLWGQMQSDAMALLWKGGRPSTQRR